MSKYDKMVVIVAQHGERYVGTVDGKNDVEAGRAVLLKDARLLLCHTEALGSPTGQITGLKTFTSILSIDAMPGALEELKVVPSAWYFLDKVSPEVHKTFDVLFKKCEENEAQNRARAAGIHLAGSKD